MAAADETESAREAGLETEPYRSGRGRSSFALATLLAATVVFDVHVITGDGTGDLDLLTGTGLLLVIASAFGWLAWTVRSVANRRILGLPPDKRHPFVAIGFFLALVFFQPALPYFVVFDELRARPVSASGRIAGIAALVAWTPVALFGRDGPSWAAIPATIAVALFAWMVHQLESAEAQLARERGLVSGPATF